MADLTSLVARLGGHPLALSQAANLMSERGITASKYLREYDVRLEKLLRGRPSARRYSNGSVNATLGLSYDQLISRDPTAAALLILFGYLDASNLSFQILDVFHKARTIGLFGEEEPPLNPSCPWIPGLVPTWLWDICSSESLYLDCFASMRQLSFIRRNDKSSSFSLHPLVHQWALQFCGTEDVRQMTIAACNVIATAVPHIELDVGGIQHKYIQPHVERIYPLLPKDLGRFEGTVMSLRGLSVFFQVMGPQSTALYLLEAAVQVAETRYGAYHRISVQATYQLGTFYQNIQESLKAIEILESLRPDVSLVEFLEGRTAQENKLISQLHLDLRLWPAYHNTGQEDRAMQTLNEVGRIAEESKDTRLGPYLLFMYKLMLRPDQLDMDEVAELGMKALNVMDNPDLWPARAFSPQVNKGAMQYAIGSKFATAYSLEDRKKAAPFLRRALQTAKDNLGTLSSESLVSLPNTE